MKSDLEVARSVELQPIEDVAHRAGIPSEALYRHGRYLAKLDMAFVDDLNSAARGRLVLVTAINPTPAGEGKTTTTIGLGDALNRTGRRAIVALREPSLGPVFGSKGGATGGGRAQAAPMEAINLHFTGDFHAITSAHNLLATLIDNHLHWGNTLGIDARSIVWRRVLDMNDRALRQIVIGLGDGANGTTRETGFDITVASEVMAILCLAEDLADLQVRLGRIVVGRRSDGTEVTAGDLGAVGAMTVLLRDALQPNLVQSLEATPILMHGGPFANIAHGCNSNIATRTALALAEFTVTEAGFGADLGAEKFCDIAARAGDFAPEVAVVVATLRALKYQGGAALREISMPNASALEAGLANLGRHIENMRAFGLVPVVAINHFEGDTQAELDVVIDHCRDHHATRAIVCRHWAQGGAGAEELARVVAKICDNPTIASDFYPLYELQQPLTAKIETIATSIYRAGSVSYSTKAKRDLRLFEQSGWGDLPVCIAKTPYSFSSDPSRLGAPSGHILPVREVRLCAGAGFVVAICGDVMTMPGLPRVPGAERIGLNERGQIDGLS